MKNNSEVTIEQVLPYTKNIEAQRSKKAMVESQKGNKVFDMIGTIKCKAEPEGK